MSPGRTRATTWRLLFVGAACAAVLAQERSQDKQAADPDAPIEDVTAGAEAEPAAGAREPEIVKRSVAYGGSLHPRQSPFLVARGDGRTDLGCLATDLGLGDRVEIRDVTAVRSSKDPVTPTRVSEAYSEIVRPVGVRDREDRLVVLWTELVDGTPQLRASRESAGAEGTAKDRKFGPAATLTRGPRPNVNPEAALGPDGRVWVAWESDRDVLLAPLSPEGDALGASRQAGDGRGSDLDPVLASSGGLLWIGWSQYRGRDYDVMLRSFDPKAGPDAAGVLGEPLNVSADGVSDDVHPALVAGPEGAALIVPGDSGELWLAWDSVIISHRGNSAPEELRVAPMADRVTVSVRCARVREGRVQVPKSDAPGVPHGVVAGAPLQSTGGGSPQLAFDRAGRLWISHRFLRRRPNTKSRYDFPVLLQRLTAEGWTDPLQIDESGGIPEAAPLVADRESDGVLVAFHLNDRLDLPHRTLRELPDRLVAPLEKLGVQCTIWCGAESIGFARVAAAIGEGAAAAPAMVDARSRLEPLHPHPFGDRLEDPFVTGERHFEVVRGDERYQVWWGDLHRHSSISRCSNGMEPTPQDRWTSGRDVHLCDFMALTDHSGAIDPFAWWRLDKFGWFFQSPTFCTLLGWEWSTYDFGHHNVILDGRMAPLVSEDETLETLYGRLPPGACVTIPHHSSDARFPNDLGMIDDRFTRLIEVYQARRGNFEFDGCFKQAPGASVIGSFVQDGLNAGKRLGIVASTDHGHGASYACVLSEKLDRASLFAALHARRTYGATTKGMLVDLRVNEALMGEEIAADGASPLKLKLTARAGRELADVVVFKNGRVFQSLREAASGTAEGGAAPRAANTFAPLRFVLKLRPGDAPASEWTLRLKVPGAHLSGLETHRRLGRGKGPVWTVREDEATFTVPTGFVAKEPGGELEYPLHVHAPADSQATIVTELDEKTMTLAELAARMLGGRRSSGMSWQARLELGDAVIALDRGLGTSELTREWEDPELAEGTSWYYARIVDRDGEIAWSSPIFVTRK